MQRPADGRKAVGLKREKVDGRQDMVGFTENCLY